MQFPEIQIDPTNPIAFTFALLLALLNILPKLQSAMVDTFLYNLLSTVYYGIKTAVPDLKCNQYRSY